MSGRRRLAAVMLLALAPLAGCLDADPAPTVDAAARVPVAQVDSRVSPMLFGAHAPWNDLGNFTVNGGELVRDRSFRLGNRFWRPVIAGNGTLQFSQADGVPALPDSPVYPGHAVLTARAANTLACAYHRLHDRIEPGQYTLEFSSRGDRARPSLLLVVVDKAYAKLAREAFDATETDTWKRHSIVLEVHTAAAEADLGLCVASAGTAQIDEVRFFRSGASPTVDPAVKKLITELGIRSLRWPGGSDVNTLDWTETIGPLRSRGEQSLLYGGLQTPSFGLHEFLDLCEELNLAPVIAVNVLDTPARAAELVEYILGDAASEQGRKRARNGRQAPWRFATRFEIGNEPAREYGDASQLGMAGEKYAERASAVAAGMTAAAKRASQTIDISGVAEGGLQLAEWLTPGGNTITSLLYNWNAQVFGRPGGIGVTAAHAHYYTYFDHAPDPRRQFENLMGSGEVLRRTLDEKVRPFTKNLPIWITEYQILIESKGVVQASFTKDFESGLVVADILTTMIKQGIPVAHIHNLSEVGAFGLFVRGDSGWYLRPAAHVFRLFSATAGERRIDLELSARGPGAPYRFESAVGNIPRGLTYERVSGVATLDGKTNRPRVFLLNRDFSADATITVRVPGYDLGSAAVHWYQHRELAANNDGRSHDEVTVRSEKIRGGTPWTIVVPAHALVRIDFD